MDIHTTLTHSTAASLPEGTSSLYRRLRDHRRDLTALAVSTDILHRVRCGFDAVADGDELAELCYRAAAHRHPEASRDALFALAAAALEHLAPTRPARAEVARCVACGAPEQAETSHAATLSCTHPAAARTVAQ